MGDVRLAVVYYSTYGHNHAMAEAAEKAARDAGADVRLRKVRETAPPEVVKSMEAWAGHAEKTAHIPVATPADMEWANAFLFSAPTRFGTVASQMRAFIDTLGPAWQAGKLASKAASAMSSAMNMHGGQESTLLGLYTTFFHWGCIIVPPGYTDPSIYAAGGNPYGTTATAGKDDVDDKVLAAVAAQTRRLVAFAAKLAD